MSNVGTVSHALISESMLACLHTISLWAWAHIPGHYGQIEEIEISMEFREHPNQIYAACAYAYINTFMFFLVCSGQYVS